MQLMNLKIVPVDPGVALPFLKAAEQAG